MPIITLKNIIHENKVSKNGKAYVSCKLVVARKDGGKDSWITGFGSEITKTWSAGDSVDVDLEQNDRGYWSFKENNNSKPSPDKKLELLKEINAKLDLLLKVKPEEIAKDFGGEVVKSGKDEITTEMIPF